MKAKDPAHWLQEEHKKVDELTAHMRTLVAMPPRSHQDRWIKDARAGFRRLAEHFTHHTRMEEEGGYMADVLRRRPTLARDVEQLEHEHGELDQLMTQIQATLDDLSPHDQLLIRDCCARIQTFLTHVERHEERENHLVLYTFTQDSGGQD